VLPTSNLFELELETIRSAQSGLSMTRRPTIKDVAAAAEVSASTVSAVLNGSAPTSPGVRERVANAVALLGYQAEAHARNLRRRRAHAVGLVIPDPSNPFFIEVAMGVQSKALESGMVVVLCATDEAAELDAYCAHLLQARYVDGLIFTSGGHRLPGELGLLGSKVPVVMADDLFADAPYPFVGSDNRGGAQTAARLALDHGHRRIAILAGPPEVWTAEQRLAGYLDELAKEGLAPATVIRGDYRVQSGRQASAAILESGATTVLAANDLMAIGLIQTCLQAGVRIPGDLSVVGFDDIPTASYLAPQLSTVRQPGREIGRAAMAALLSQLAGHTPDDRLLLPTQLVVRDTLGTPS
jgi:DNA-binding LacI/PurR family transcriptional regulator